MSEIMKKWNEKWKAQRLQLLFSELGEKEKEFFEHLEIVNVKEIEYMNDYHGEGNEFDRIIEVIHKGETYYICEDAGTFLITSNENVDYTDMWCEFFEPQQMTKEIHVYEKQVNSFLRAFNFIEFENEYIKEEAKKQIKEEEKAYIGMKCIGIEFDTEEREYYMVFDNGTKIPYKKEERNIKELYHN